MKAYVGQTRSRNMIARLDRYGIGECVCPGEALAKRTPWFLDNGAFRAFRAGKTFDVYGFEAALEASRLARVAPDFVVAPDIVGGGMVSLETSLGWLGRMASDRPYLAVQDGMDAASVSRVAPGFAGLFVGGSMPWKLRTGFAWVALAHSFGVPCHIGQVGNPRHVRWAIEIGADSIDSCKPLWCVEYLEAFADALKPTGQRGLFA